jgi:hypothetical protein
MKINCNKKIYKNVTLTYRSFLFLARLDVLERSLSDERVPERDNDLDDVPDGVCDGLRLRDLLTDRDDERDSDPVEDGVRDLDLEERDEPDDDDVDLLRDE